MVHLSPTLLDQLVHVTILTVLHHNEQPATLLINDMVNILHNIWVLQFTQSINLCHQLLPLSVLHTPVVKLFPTEHFVVFFAAHFEHATKATFTDLLESLVLIHHNT